uniref:Uncharacterized protein n=1 Tax=Avena sativa TaxID=4498 RepID=A0ACD5XYG5_AVESA
MMAAQKQRQEKEGVGGSSVSTPSAICIDKGFWSLLAHGCLTTLGLTTCSDFFAGPDTSRSHDKEVFSCSSKLVDLRTDNKTGLFASPICSLLSSTLTRLNLGFEDKVERLPKEQEEALQLLTSLQEIRFSWGPKLQRLPAGLHKLINLKKLMIDAFFAIQSLPSLPSSLHELQIRDCGAIKSLPNSLPSSLEKLMISKCNAIKLLPKDGLPSSMRELIVHDRNSEELKRQCHKLIGTIPIIRA